MASANSAWQLAQINIAVAREEMDSPVMSGFTTRLDEINTIAEDSDGFVWRLQTEDGDATSIRVFDDPLVLINMSVWRDVDSLKQFVYRSTHVELLQDREAWFTKIVQAHQALWWVPAGHQPTIEEGKERLEELQQHGPTARAFNFAQPYEPSADSSETP